MRLITRSGLRLSYSTRGVGQVVVLLHPVGLRGLFWKPVVSALETEFRLICPDLRGHGESDVPSGGFTLSDIAADVADLIRAVGSPPAIVCGCSLGGMIAQELAVSVPELLCGVVVANTGYTRDEAGRKAVIGRAAAARRGMPAILDTTLARWFSEEFSAAQPETVEMVKRWLLDNDPVVHARCWEAMADLDFSGRLEEIDMPALAIAGTGDQSVPVQVVRDLAEKIPRADCAVIEGAGHLTPLERPKEFAALLRGLAMRAARSQ